MTTPEPRRRAASLVLFGLSVVGALIGTFILVLHITRDPLADIHAYYDAGQRLNAGMPLYDQSASTSTSHFYFYPPLLAVAFRPLALLPFGAAAAIWMAVVLGTFVATLVLLGLRSRWTWLALGCLAPAIAWSVTIGQAHVITTFLMALGTPFGLALAGHLKVFPALAAIYWLGRRDWGHLGRFIAWATGLTALSFILEPAGTIAFLGFPSFDLVGEVTNLSPYALSPALWALGVVILLVLALTTARTRYGWVTAVALTVLVNPRLFMYQFSSFLAAFRRPSDGAAH